MTVTKTGRVGGLRGATGGITVDLQALADESEANAGAAAASATEAAGYVTTAEAAADELLDFPAVIGRSASDATTVTYGSTTPDTTTYSTALAGGNLIPTKDRGTVEISVRMSATSTGYIDAIYMTTGEILATSSLLSLASGVNDLGACFDRIVFPAETAFSYRRASGGNIRSAVASSQDQIFGYSATTEVGDGKINSFTTSASIALAIEVRLRCTTDDHETRLSAAVGSMPHTTTIALDKFAGTATPSGWTLGTATVNDGLHWSGTGGWTEVAYSDKSATITRRRLVARVTMHDITSKFGLMCKPDANGLGGIFMLDGTAGNIEAYSWSSTGGGAGTLCKQQAIPFTLIDERSYVMEVLCLDHEFRLTLTDPITRDAVTIEYSLGTNNAAAFCGKHGLVFFSGDVTVDWLEVTALHPSNPSIIISGDSNTDNRAFPAIRRGWAYQIAELFPQGEVMNVAKSSDTTAMQLARIATWLTPFSPKYVILATGTNDGAQATWRTNMALLIAAVEARGAEPILVCLMPTAAGFSSAINDDIRSGYFGQYRYIDHAKALSVGHDGVTWTAAYNRGDSVHDNIVGQHVRFEQTLIDAPYLFTEIRSPAYGKIERLSGISAIETQSGTTYTLLLADNGKVIEFTNASNVTVTLPNSLPVGFNCVLVQAGAGQVIMSPQSGAALRHPDGSTTSYAQWSQIALYVRSNSGVAAEWVAAGDLV